MEEPTTNRTAVAHNPFRYYGTMLLHLALILAWLASPFYMDWKYVVLIGIIYYLQFPILGGCVLTKLQFKGERNEFLAYYSQKLGLPMGSLFFRIAGYLIPVLLILVSFLRQSPSFS